MKKLLKIILISLSVILITSIIIYNNINTISANINNTTINFKKDNFLQIPIKINNINSYSLFDTGANISCIDSAAVEKYNITVLPFVRTILNYNKLFLSY